MILKGPFLILDTVRWGGLESFVRQIKPRFNLLFVYFWKAFSWVSFIFLVFVKGTWGGSCCYERKVTNGILQVLE